MATELYTIPEAAEYFRVSRQRLWKLVSEGRIKAQRVGQQWLIKERDLLKIEWKSAGRPRASNHQPGRLRKAELK
jgi:excisionase family DNA binding protein